MKYKRYNCRGRRELFEIAKSSEFVHRNYSFFGRCPEKL